MRFHIMTSHYSLRVIVFSCQKKVEIFEYLYPFELLYREFSDIRKESSDIDFLKSKFNKLGLSSHLRLKHSLLEEILSKKELESLKNLSKNPDIIIQKSDKGNSVVNLGKKVYIEKMNKMLDKNKYFLRLSIQEEKHYNFLINMEKNRLTSLIRKYMINFVLIHTLVFCMVWLNSTNSS